MTTKTVSLKSHAHRMVYADHPDLERWRIASCVRDGCDYARTIHRVELAWWSPPLNCEGQE